MNILGVGGAELVLILLIMLVVAGPKRMLQWAYIAGQYLGQLRVMWAQMMDIVQKEVDDAGMDIKVPRTPPTRGEIDRTIRSALRPLQSPVEEVMKEVKAETHQIQKETKAISKSVNDDLNGKGKPASFGTWSGAGGAANANTNDDQPGDQPNQEGRG